MYTQESSLPSRGRDHPGPYSGPEMDAYSSYTVSTWMERRGVSFCRPPLPPLDIPRAFDEQSKRDKYKLVIVLPPTTDVDDRQAEETPEDFEVRTIGVQTEGVVPSPRIPSPDYDAEEVFYEGADRWEQPSEYYYSQTSTPDSEGSPHFIRRLLRSSSSALDSPPPFPKRVTFTDFRGDPPSRAHSVDSDSRERVSWRDLITTRQGRPEASSCYRQDWAVGYNRPRKGWDSPPWLPGSPSGRMTPTEAVIHSERSPRPFDRRLQWIMRNTHARAHSLDRILDSSASGQRKHLKMEARRAHLGGMIYAYSSSDIAERCEQFGRVQPMSSQKSTERSSYGPGPPLKQLRSYSVDTHPVASTPQQGRARQRSISGSVNLKKTPVRRVDEEALKRSRLHNSQYELSQDLLDKQVEMLERKYGGVRARKAALTIQRAFRKYCIVKRFQDIANASKGERRLSRRLPGFDLESKEWMICNGGNSANHRLFPQHQMTLSGVPYDDEKKIAANQQCSVHSYAHMDTSLKSTFNALYQELSETLEGENGRLSKTSHSQSFRERRNNQHGDINVHNDTHSLTEEHFMGASDSLRLVRGASPHRYHANLPDNSATLYSGTYQTPVIRPTSVPSHPAWTVAPSNGAQRTMVCSPSPHIGPSPLAAHQDDHYHTARESLSSEDSAILVEGEGLENHNLHRNNYTRHSMTMPSSPAKSYGDTSLQRTPARASDVALGRKVAAARGNQRKIPPQVPKRTSSIASHDIRGVDSSSTPSPVVEIPGRYESTPVTTTAHDRSTNGKACPVEASPVWKRKSLIIAEQISPAGPLEDKRLSNISENSEDSTEGTGYSSSPPTSAEVSHSYPLLSYSDSEPRTPQEIPVIPPGFKVSEIQRKRQYRVGLNLFNKKPERGVRYLIHRGFLEASPQAVARFLLTRKGLSKQMIGEYLGNLQSQFNMMVLECFSQELDLAGMQVDVALRKFQTFFRMPGEAQKIERLVEVFSHRYNECNHDIVSKFHNPDTVFVLAFAIIMLNTDLHTPNMKAERRMKLEEFIKNLRGIDDGHDLDRSMLVGIYERIKVNEFKMGSDHVSQVMKVQQTIVGKKPNLALPHRRLVCYCRLYEVYDITKKERPGVHQREVFLFNDMLMVTKIFSKKKNSVTYTFRQSFPLCGMSVTLFEAPYYPHGIRLSQRVDDKVLVTFNARNEHDRSKFVEDLKESILEMDEMENIRIETELEKQKVVRIRSTENRDSGVADMEIIPSATKDGKLAPDSLSTNLKRSALSNSLLDLQEQHMNKPMRRGSAGSLDSGMSISFQSSAASTVSHDSSPQIVHAGSTSSGSGSSLNSSRSASDSPGSASLGTKPSGQQGFLGGLFGKKGKHASKNPTRKTLDTSNV